MMTVLLPLLKLLFAHVLSDFVLQTDTICRKKNGYGREMITYQLLHSLIHAVVSYLVLADWSNWIVPVVIFITHLAMDVVKPTSVFLALLIKRWTPQDGGGSALPNVGKTIGYLERILIQTFVLIGRFEGVGFLLAAKSIFRFGELSKASEIRTTEYVLIGTLASFTIAIMIGLVARMMI